MKCSKIINIIEELAPPSLALSWDNVGLIIGNADDNISTILLALDINDQVIDEAIDINAQLIITHHPPIFKGIKNITTDSATGRYLIKLLQNKISVYTSHTNLDICNRGVNDTLFKILQLKDKVNLNTYENGHSLGRIGNTNKSYTLLEFTKFVSNKLNVSIVRYVGDPNSIITKVALCGGSASDQEMFNLALQNGAHVYLTGDIRYHEAFNAIGMGLNLIDATHFATENYALLDVKTYIENKVNEDIKIFISNADLQPFKGIN